MERLRLTGIRISEVYLFAVAVPQDFLRFFLECPFTVKSYALEFHQRIAFSRSSLSVRKVLFSRRFRTQLADLGPVANIVLHIGLQGFRPMAKRHQPIGIWLIACGKALVSH